MVKRKHQKVGDKIEKIALHDIVMKSEFRNADAENPKKLELFDL